MQLTNLQQKIPLGRQILDRDYNRDITAIERSISTAKIRQGGYFQIDPVIKIFTTENISG